MDILEIELLTDNFAETTKFYSEVLGLEILCQDNISISFQVGHSVLVFTKSENLSPKYHFAFNIPCNKIEEAILWTSTRTNLITIANNEIITDFDSWNAHAIFFYDNNGNILEFIARHDLNNESEISFRHSSILSISEIGIVTGSPLQLAGKLHSENGINYFSKGTKSESFVVLGNDNGLLVIVKESRNWYPTNLPAEKFYTRIKLKDNDEIVELNLN